MVRSGNASHHRAEQPFGFRLLALGEQPRDRTGGAAGQQQQSLGMRARALERQLRLQRRVGVQEADGRQALQVRQPRGVLRQQHQRVGRQAGIVGPRQRDLAADDRLHALAGAVLANSSAPNNCSVIATAGIPASRASAGILSALMAPSLSEYAE